MSEKANPPRVLQFVPGYRFGGVESLLMSMYRALDKNKLQFDFLMDTVDHYDDFDEIRAEGGRIFQLGRLLDDVPKWIHSMNEIFKNYGHEYVAMHSHDPMRSLPLCLGAMKTGIKKRIIHSHTDSLEGSPKRFVAPLIYSATVPFGTDYWACSKAAGHHVFGRHRRFMVFNNAINSGDFIFNAEERRKIRSERNIPPDALVIGHSGRFTYQKNHLKIVRIFSELKKGRHDAHLLLLGDGPLKDEVQVLARELSVIKDIHFLGNVRDVGRYLSAMDVFLLPSHFEGLCISLVEAQANGLPCLASDVLHDEVKITQDISCLHVNEADEAWTNKIVQLHQRGRASSQGNIELIKVAGFDMKTQVSKIMSSYLE